jgi:hypothetical protein
VQVALRIEALRALSVVAARNIGAGTCNPHGFRTDAQADVTVPERQLLARTMRRTDTLMFR